MTALPRSQGRLRSPIEGAPFNAPPKLGRVPLMDESEALNPALLSRPQVKRLSTAQGARVRTWSGVYEQKCSSLPTPLPRRTTRRAVVATPASSARAPLSEHWRRDRPALLSDTTSTPA